MVKKVEAKSYMISPSLEFSVNKLSMKTPAMQEKRRRLRICMLAYAFYENDTRILQYATALAQRGDTVDVIALRRDDTSPEFEVLNGVNVYRIQRRTVNERSLFTYVSRIASFFFRSALFLHQRHREHGYDVVHVHNVPDFLVFSAISPKLKKVPILLDIHDLLPEFYASKFKVTRNSFFFKLCVLVELYSTKFATHVIVANDLWCDRLIARSSQNQKCSVIRNRPDLSIFTKSADWKRVKNDKFILTYPGSLNWHQGLDIAIRAFAKVANEIPDSEFHIYGEGPTKSALITLASALKMQDRIFFHNFIPSRQIAQVMAATDLAIEPKRSTSAFGNEALSTKIMEFMSLGVPVIACKTKIHAYYYDDSIIQYYENDDVSQLAEQILRLRNSPDLRANLVENAQKYVENNTWDARKHEYLYLVDSLLNTNMVVAVANQVLL